MQRPNVLLVAGVLMIACGSHGSSTPTPVGAQLAPDTGPAAVPGDVKANARACAGRVDARGHVPLADIVPAMLDGTDVAPGSWHLAAARSITAAACRGGRGTSASHGTGSG